MRSERRATLYAGLCVLFSAVSASAGIDDLCGSAPKCWQYHRGVCYGYYPTKWRSWESACGAPTPIGADARILHESGQPVRTGSEPPRAPTLATPPAMVKPSPRMESTGPTSQHSEPPATSFGALSLKKIEPAGVPTTTR